MAAPIILWRKKSGAAGNSIFEVWVPNMCIKNLDSFDDRNGDGLIGG
jgi:hypothetical protein